MGHTRGVPTNHRSHPSPGRPNSNSTPRPSCTSAQALLSIVRFCCPSVSGIPAPFANTVLFDFSQSIDSRPSRSSQKAPREQFQSSRFLIRFPWYVSVRCVCCIELSSCIGLPSQSCHASHRLSNLLSFFHDLCSASNQLQRTFSM
jgi:hypothetical protein